MSKYPANAAITYTAVATTQGMPSNTFTYSWTFDDGGTGNTASLAHTWTTNGNHLATVLVTDNATGGTATTNKTIEVSDAEWVGNTAAARGWDTITYGGGLFVAAADDNGSGTGGILTSPDGSTWTARNSPVATNFTGSAYGNGTFVLVGTDAGVNYVVYSTDGITWTAPTFPAKQWTCVAFGNGVFVALSYLNGTTNQAMTSPDGITWTSRNTSSDQTWSAICFGGGQFVAVCGGSTVITSPDGINWTTRTGAAVKSWRRIAYGNGIYVAVADANTTGQVMWSSDAITWNLVTIPGSKSVEDVAFGNGQFIITPSDTGLSWGSYMTTDAQTFWEVPTNVSNGVWACAVYGTDRFVAMSRSASDLRAQVLLW